LKERVEAYALSYWRQRLELEAKASRIPVPALQPYVRWDRSRWPKRSSEAGADQVDLTEHYTSLLNVNFHPFFDLDEAGNHLGSLPAGVVSFSGVVFDVRGVVQLRCSFPGSEPFVRSWEKMPVRLEGIRIGRRFGRLFALHAVSQGIESQGVRVGSYVLHYADGQRAELPIICGQHVRNWWASVDEPQPTAALSHGAVAWTGQGSQDGTRSALRRLYLSSYYNPRPEVPIDFVDFTSSMTRAAPFVVAITLGE
jgi:hypothetical protein